MAHKNGLCGFVELTRRENGKTRNLDLEVRRKDQKAIQRIVTLSQEIIVLVAIVKLQKRMSR